MEHNDVIEIDLLKLVKALFKKAWLIILVAVIVAAAVFGCVKMTFTPNYTAAATMCVKGAENDVAFTSSSAATRINTFVAFLGTQTVLEEISEASGLELSPEAVSGMIKAEAINGSEMLAVTATTSAPEEAILIANTAAEVLEEKAEMIHGENSLIIFESASETTVTQNGSKAIQKSVVAAVLAAVLVCALIVAKELYQDWKVSKEKK